MTPVFRFPREHGAWAMFLTCLAGGAALDVLAGVSAVRVAALAAGLVCWLAAEDWMHSLAAAVLRSARRGRSDWRSPAGWALAAAGAACLAAATPPGAAAGWALSVGIAAAGGGLVLALRTLLPPLDLALLAPSSLAPTMPALLAVFLAWPGCPSCVAAWWAWPAGYAVATTVFIHALLRSAPARPAVFCAPLVPFAGLVIAASAAGCPAGTIGFALLTGRVAWRLRSRDAALRAGGGPPAPAEVRALGLETTLWSLLLAALWVRAFLGRI